MDDAAAQAAVETGNSTRTQIESTASDLKAAFSGVRWEGPDAEEFTPRFTQTIDSKLNSLLSDLQQKVTEFDQDIAEQLDASNG